MKTKIATAIVLAALSGCAPGSPHPAVTSSSVLSKQSASVPDPRQRLALPRFVSVNIPNLHYIEDHWQFDSTMRYRLPSEFEIRDALEAVHQMGGRVVRIYALSVRKPTDPVAVPRHVNGPGKFDEAAFKALDLVLALAREYGIQVIVPFVDNWQWWGGVAEYAAFRSLKRDAFWTSEQLFSDYERTLEFVITRKNTVNGVIYRDDPTIYAWETGNELEAPWTWTERAAYAIRKLDALHPIIDGIHSRFIRDEALESPLIDLLTTHHYTDGEQIVNDVRANLLRIDGAKPYFVGEFGFVPPKAVERVLDAAISEQALGAMIWSLRFRNRDGGFYAHAEKPGFQSYHWPGFESGAAYDERAILTILQSRARRITGLASAASRQPPIAPTLLPHSQPTALYWQGSAGAESYVLERSASLNGEWQVVSANITDAALPYRPQYVDNDVNLGTDAYYRVSAANSSGRSPASNIVGPVRASSRRLVDEFKTSEHHHQSGTLEFVSHDPMVFKMDDTRLRATAGAITYEPGGLLRAFMLDVFLMEAGKLPTVSTSQDGRQWKVLKPEVQEFPGAVDTPTWPRPARLRALPPMGSSKLRVEFASGVELGRLELGFTPSNDRSE